MPDLLLRGLLAFICWNTRRLQFGLYVLATVMDSYCGASDLCSGWKENRDSPKEIIRVVIEKFKEIKPYQ